MSRGAAKVTELLNKYRGIRSLHPVVTFLCADSEEFKVFFSKGLQHDLAVIQSRSQNLDDHEISITQKTFAILMQDKQTHVAGLELYVEEILGLSIVGQAKREKFLKDLVVAKDLLVKERVSESISENDLFRTFASPEASKHHDKTSTAKLTTLEYAADDAHLDKLWIMYREARDDFLSTANATQDARTSAARFLRDTIENCIDYLEVGQWVNTSYTPEELQGMMRELRATLKIATNAAELGLGGKKRRFDSTEDVPRVPKHMRYRDPVKQHLATGRLVETPDKTSQYRRPKREASDVQDGSRGCISSNAHWAAHSQRRRPTHDSYRPYHSRLVDSYRPC